MGRVGQIRHRSLQKLQREQGTLQLARSLFSYSCFSLPIFLVVVTQRTRCSLFPDCWPSWWEGNSGIVLMLRTESCCFPSAQQGGKWTL